MKDVFAFLKLIIIAAIALAVLLMGYTFYDAYQSKRIFAPPPPMTEAEMRIAAANVWVWFFVKVSLLVLLLLTMLLAAVRFLYAPAIKNLRIYPDERGNWPLLKLPKYKDHTGAVNQPFHNENLSVLPAKNYAYNGRVAYDSYQEDATDVQYKYANQSWGHQVAQAFASTGKITSAATKSVIGRPPELIERDQLRAERERIKRDIDQQRLDRAQTKALPEIQEPTTVMQPISIHKAIELSSVNDWVIGQAADVQPVENFKRVGDLLRFYPKNGHLAILGGTGSGKTAGTGWHVVIYARLFNYHTIVFDGKGGLDWGKYESHVERYDMTDQTIAELWSAIYYEYIQRYNLLRSVNVEHVDALPASMRPKPIFLIAEEFGAPWVSLKKLNKTTHDVLSGKIDELFRMCRATGITICMMDQAPEAWTQQMRGNCKFATVYKLNGKAAGAFDEHYLSKLKDVGVFSRDNVFYNAWHAKAEIDIRTFLPAQPKKLLETGNVSAGFQSVSAGVSGRFQTETLPVSNHGAKRSAPVVETPETTETGSGGTQGKTDKNDLPPLPRSLMVSFRKTQDWDEFCKGLFVVHDDMTQAVLRRVMAFVDDKGKPQNAYKKLGYKMYHTYSPLAKKDQS